jgi:hypothetical protein
LQHCCYCGNSFCSNCSHTDGYCHDKQCVEEHRNSNDSWSLGNFLGDLI